MVLPPGGRVSENRYRVRQALIREQAFECVQKRLRIGVTLSEELQLHPEQSTDAFVFHHPEAKYFSV